jgi:hypothetical protein
VCVCVWGGGGEFGMLEGEVVRRRCPCERSGGGGSGGSGGSGAFRHQPIQYVQLQVLLLCQLRSLEASSRLPSKRKFRHPEK